MRWFGGIKQRDVALVVVGAVASAAVLSAGTRIAASPEPRPASDASRTSKSGSSPTNVSEDGSRASKPCAQSTIELVASHAEPEGGHGDDDVDQVRFELQKLQQQRSKLKEELRSVEKELSKREEPAPYEYDLTQSQWKELAAAGRIKYRVPCQMAKDSGWSIDPAIVNSLGLSPDDGHVIMEAFGRSNERLWATVKPMCLAIVQREDVVESLGFDACKTLVEQAQQREDPMASADAQRLVAEVRAGLRQPPTEDESPPNLYRLYYAMTGEGEQFESDLSESFGPDTAKRIWHSFPCAGTMRF